jgi:AraC-like DNA-binding protein
VELRDREVAARLEVESLEMLLGYLSASEPDETPAERRRAALQARRSMVLNMEVPLTIAEICRAVHATQRTLHFGFQRRLD